MTEEYGTTGSCWKSITEALENSVFFFSYFVATLSSELSQLMAVTVSTFLCYFVPLHNFLTIFKIVICAYR